MKPVATTLLLLSILSVAVFGFFMMRGENMHMFCAAALGEKAPCPLDGNLALANFHLNILKNFSTATPAGTSLILIMLTVLVAFLATVTAITLRESPLGIFRGGIVSRLKLINLRTSQLITKLTHWLSFHETSPTVALRT